MYAPSGASKVSITPPWDSDDIFRLDFPYDTKRDEFVSRTYQGPDGRWIRCDMTMNLFMRNTGGSDGAGLCVFTSIQHSVHYQGLGLYGFRKFMESKPGGGWPQKVDRMLKEFASARNLRIPPYRHLYGLQSINEVKMAVNKGYMVCTTWGTDYSHYGGQTIAHMVNMVYLDDEWGAILDNNFINEFLWVKRPSFDKYVAWTGGRNDGAWFIIFDVNGIPIRGDK